MFIDLLIKTMKAYRYAAEHRYTVIITAACAAAVAVAIVFIVQTAELTADVNGYEDEIAALTLEMEQWEGAAAENEVLSAENERVRLENEQLSDENNAVAAENDELERQNGELLKKYSGLSKPN